VRTAEKGKKKRKNENRQSLSSRRRKHTRKKRASTPKGDPSVPHFVRIGKKLSQTKRGKG